MPGIQLFITCLVDSFYPKTGEAIVSILHRLGVDVEFVPDQTCCGQPNFNAGLRAEARLVAEHTIRVFEKTTGDIVTPSGSCAHMLKHGYSELFADDPAWLTRAQALASRVFEFTEYIVDKLGVTDLGAQWNGTLTYHPSCHTLRGMNIDRQPRALLANVRGATILELPNAEECCGFGGIFSMEHPELSAEWLKRKIGNLESTNSPTLVVTEAGCLMHIAGGLHRQKKRQRVVHIAEVLGNR
ncbi:MAG: Fe-S oxidoreductase [Anaerolineales bacterium]|nr:(Fe-S)-binding protein [Anaerolineae bacterium]PWB73440.1 MAG: Fe-S oxidoreductase [Anaerolineales bacterium]